MKKTVFCTNFSRRVFEPAHEGLWETKLGPYVAERLTRDVELPMLFIRDAIRNGALRAMWPPEELER